MRIPILALLVACGCSAVSDAPPSDARLDDPPETVEAYFDTRATLMSALDDAIGDAQADGVQACRVIAVGAKACGGPAAYRVYSATDGDATEVESIASRITALDEYANREFGLVSNCMIQVEPAPTVEDGRCTASGPR